MKEADNERKINFMHWHGFRNEKKGKRLAFTWM